MATSTVFEIILGLLGGLALFLYGMYMMSSGLEAAAGNKLKKILEKLTTNRFLGVAVGAGITAAVQSSSTTTVMTVGFVNSGIMTLRQAIWITMGANIGTNITSQMIALDVGKIAPIIALVGVVMILFLRGKRIHHTGQIIAGLGVLFIGMRLMSSAMGPLREYEAFRNLMVQFSNPLLGILFGILVTVLIQSSSASVGILQALAVSGLIGLPSAVFVLFGQNIGTCVTPILGSLSASRTAKRAALVHLTFNVIGTILFFFIVTQTPFVSFMEGFTPLKPASQIANVHFIFNITTTLVLLPFGALLERFATWILPERMDESKGDQYLLFMDTSLTKNEHRIGSVAIFTAQLQREIERMLAMSRLNIERSFKVILKNSDRIQDNIEKTEDYIDYLNKEVSKAISQMITVEMPASDSIAINSYFKIAGNIERIGDHAMNIAGYANLMERKALTFSDTAKREVEQMLKTSLESLDMLYKIDDPSPDNLHVKMRAAEQMIDDMTLDYRLRQIERMKTGECSGEACVIYSEMLTDYERIGDHLLNIAQALAAAGQSRIQAPASANPETLPADAAAPKSKA